MLFGIGIWSLMILFYIVGDEASRETRPQYSLNFELAKLKRDWSWKWNMLYEIMVVYVNAMIYNVGSKKTWIWNNE